MEEGSVRLTSFVVCRSWASNRLRTALSIFGIAMGIAVVIAIHVIDHNTIQSRLRQAQGDTGRFDFELIPLDGERSDQELRELLQETPGIDRVSLLHPGWVHLSFKGEDLGAVRLYGLSPLPSRAFAQYLVAAGEDLNDLDATDQVLISSGMASLLGIVIGDRIDISTLRAATAMRCKDGVLAPSKAEQTQPPSEQTVQIKGLLAPAQLGRQNSGMVIIGQVALAQRFAADERSLFQVNRAVGSSIDRLRQDLQTDFQVRDERSALLGEAADERAFRNGVKILGCLALILGMFVVFQTLSQSLVERLKQIGLLRCLGASRKAISSIFLVDAIMLAVLGAVLGIALGIGLAYLLKQLGFTTLGIGKTIDSFEIPPGPVFGTALLGLLFTFAGAAFPLYKLRNLPALRALQSRGLDPGQHDILRGVNVFLFLLLSLFLPVAYLAMTPLLLESERETLLVLGQLGGMILVFGALLLLVPSLIRSLGKGMLWPLRRILVLPVFLTSKSLTQQTGRHAASVCGVAVVLLALLSLKSITWSLRAEALQFGDRAMTGQLFMSGRGMLPSEAGKLGGLAGVDRLDLFAGVATVPFQLSGLALDASRLDGDAKIAEIYRSQRSMIVSERLAYLHGLQAGQDLELLTDQGPKRYSVLLVSDSLGFFPDERTWAVADPHWLQQDYCVGLACVERVSLGITPGSDPYEVARLAREMFPSLTWYKTGEELVAYELRDIGVDFLLFDVLLMLILCLAGLGLVNAMTIAAIGRAREIGVLRALGMSKRQIRMGFLLEGVMVGSMAALLAMVLGLPMGAMVVSGLNRVAGLSAPFAVPWPYVFAVLPLALGIGVLAAILPASRAVRQSPVESVRYE